MGATASTTTTPPMLGRVLVVLVVLATYRLTRLITWDTFPPIAAARAHVHERWGPTSWQATLIGCPWCVSPYVAAAVTAVTAATVNLPAPVLVAIAASALTGLVATNLDYAPTTDTD